MALSVERCGITPRTVSRFVNNDATWETNIKREQLEIVYAVNIKAEEENMTAYTEQSSKGQQKSFANLSDVMSAIPSDEHIESNRVTQHRRKYV
ncbi:hypothetical protein AB6A40_003556 [Gnathostoma spinigerum]|uniref:Transposase n=1 Tax=Gnathostoma spinigerum TaxID=75299 RepID=A0ABD6EJJ0_9BILA